MFKSMTGFGRGQADRSWGSLVVEISSVNHRYQEVSVRTPRDLAFLEPKIQQLLKRTYSRGRTVLRLEVLWSSDFKVLPLDTEVLQSYLRQMEELASSLGRQEVIPLESLLSLPGVAGHEGGLSDVLRDEIGGALEEALNSATEQWQRMRTQEGRALLDDVTFHLDRFEQELTTVEGYWSEARDETLKALKVRVAQLLDDFSPGAVPDESRLAQEIVILSDRWDVSEEIARAQSHLQKFRSFLDVEGPHGRKLDFLVQEMNREINTLGSKIADSATRWTVVELKTLLERIREQIQNVE
ncbi:MAG: YicC family protein [Synergistaceae bacterium]|jgi:uncharacterized protein (TIGR00255 family)|nr:YicC family protein [Synergistaceae bacterium]